jgi:hypothetical protein
LESDPESLGCIQTRNEQASRKKGKTISTSIGCIVCVCVLLALALKPVGAADDEAAQGETEEWAKEGFNDLSLFLGVTRADGENGFSVGLDYERRVSRGFGIGGLIEYTGSDFRDLIAAVSLNWHPWKELKVLAAPGVEVEREDGSDGFLFRIGTEYGIALGRGYEVAPALNFDFTSDETAIVYGVSFAKSF